MTREPQPASTPYSGHNAAIRPHIAIIGAGFSGTMLAVNLLEQDGVRVTLIECDDSRMARGVAYSARNEHNLLNVRAANMSAYPNRPDHFAQWLIDQGGEETQFAMRSTYGRYLSDCLSNAQERYGDRLTLVEGRVHDAVLAADGVTLILDGGRRIIADRAILAIGNLPPHDPPGVDRTQLSHDRYLSDPWDESFARSLNPDVPVMLLGAGLTAIDVVLRLQARGFTGPIIALSRRGLCPHSHRDGIGKAEPVLERPAATLSGLVQWARRQSQDRDWRLTVDSLRPITQVLWASAPHETRARFLRHLRPYWDIHRHRLAPTIGVEIERLVASGQLSFVAGKVRRVIQVGDTLHVTWRPRGAAESVTTQVQQLINCTGPQGDLLRSNDLLLHRLHANGSIRPDALRLGVDVDPQGRTINADGMANDQLLAIGPITRGDLWEIVAVPDIRGQAQAMAARLTQSHWVGGEGL